MSIASLDYVGRYKPITREKCLCRKGFLHSLWDTVGHSVTCQGGGCSGHPAFPTPFVFRARDKCNDSGASRRGVAKSRL
jgi:hypothetical protein